VLETRRTGQNCCSMRQRSHFRSFGARLTENADFRPVLLTLSAKEPIPRADSRVFAQTLALQGPQWRYRLKGRKILISQHCWGSVVNITAAIGRRSRTFASLLTLGLTVIAIITRLVVPAPFSTAFIFLLPISFTSWFLSWHVVALVAVVGAALLFRF
jgi:hypothetical protein